MRAHVRAVASMFFAAAEIAVLAGIVVMTVACGVLVFTLL